MLLAFDTCFSGSYYIQNLSKIFKEVFVHFTRSRTGCNDISHHIYKLFGYYPHVVLIALVSKRNSYIINTLQKVARKTIGLKPLTSQ